MKIIGEHKVTKYHAPSYKQRPNNESPKSFFYVENCLRWNQNKVFSEENACENLPLTKRIGRNDSEMLLEGGEWWTIVWISKEKDQ